MVPVLLSLPLLLGPAVFQETATAGRQSLWDLGARWKEWRTGRRKASFRGPGRRSSL
uniref:Alpha-2-glycoprotein 1, zinc n=1 Tax=Mus musculus TaxID=10090 RepID=A0A0G2JDI8_MOUSE